MVTTAIELVLASTIFYIDDGNSLVWVTVRGQETGARQVWSKAAQYLFKNG